MVPPGHPISCCSVLHRSQQKFGHTQMCFHFLPTTFARQLSQKKNVGGMATFLNIVPHPHHHSFANETPRFSLVHLFVVCWGDCSCPLSERGILFFESRLNVKCNFDIFKILFEISLLPLHHPFVVCCLLHRIGPSSEAHVKAVFAQRCCRRHLPPYVRSWYRPHLDCVLLSVSTPNAYLTCGYHLVSILVKAANI